MSRSRRGGQRNARKKAVRRSDRPVLSLAPPMCDCPACSDTGADATQMVRDFFDGADGFAECEDVLEAELVGASLVSMMSVFGDATMPALVDALIPQVEARADADALALLLAIGSVAAGLNEPLDRAASAAVNRMAGTGIPQPRWGSQLAEPMSVTECYRLFDDQETMSVLAFAFERAANRHAFLVIVDEEDCGAAVEIILLPDADQLPNAVEELRASGRAEGLTISTRILEPAELRWHAEDALDARAVHDEEDQLDGVFGGADDDDDDGLPYALLSQLLRARLTTLPPARKPAGAHGHHEDAEATPSSMRDALLRLTAGGGRADLPWGRPVPAKLPAKRKKSDGLAPIYRIKVGLRDAKPPIWRRLLVPADVSLARLHDIIQAAFGWQDSHLYVFETAYGSFGRADRDLGHRAAAPVTLEQVAGAKDKIRYTYDFGDDWEHEVLIEEVVDRDPATVYPTCTGGRRAAPPDDCGGIWGYAELVEILADPDHPEHKDRLEWLGLDDGSEFDPATLDVHEINRVLAALR